MPLTIYLVEDSTVIRDNLIPALEDLAGATVVGFSATEDAALHWLRANATGWQVLVLELFLREGSGLGLLRNCPQRNPGQRVAVLSNYATPEMRKRSLALGADAVFDKSNELDDFFAWCRGAPASA